MEIKLKPNGWHRRLQLWIFGENCPLYYNFCPYFWLTNFCILVTFIIPVLPLIRLLMLIFGGMAWLFDKWATYFEESICAPLFEAGAKKMSNDELLKSWFFYDWNHVNYIDWNEDKHRDLLMWKEEILKIDTYKICEKKQRKEHERFQIWKANTPNWEKVLGDYQTKCKANYITHQAELKAMREKMAAEETKNAQKKADAERRKQATFTAIVKYTKWLGYIVLGLAVIGIGYLLYLAGRGIWNFFLDHYYPERLISQMKFLGMWIGLVISGICISYLIYKIFSKVSCSICVGDSWIMRQLGKGCKWIGKYIIIAMTVIGDFVIFFWNGLVMLKKNYCPHIDWEKEKD